MHTRFFLFSHALKSSRIWPRSGPAPIRPRISQFICHSCKSNFSTSSILRQVKKAVQNATKNGAAPEANRKYASHLVIYNAGDMRSSFVSFWKATAIFQFGVVAVWLAPILYHNENQPDPNIRLLQAIGLTAAGAIPMALMSYLTSPFVKRIAIQIPAYAQQTRDHLMHFSSHLPAETKLEFTTLRAFPYERKTAVFLHELRALKPQWGRFANIERHKTSAFQERQASKSRWRKFLEIINEPRFKFYVKEGRNFTIKTGVPGVWENVARAIQRQTEQESVKALKGHTKKALPAAKLVREAPLRKVKRQTIRSSK